MDGIKLSKRLSAACAEVRENAFAADVCCDHGFAAAWLVQSGRARRVVATDINELPLAKARELFARLGLGERARAVLTDGLDGVKDEVTDIIIAGVGADVILDIISRAPIVRERDRRLILVPASKHARLRRGLCEGGFELVRETAVCEAGHCYTVIVAEFSGVMAMPDEAFCELGLIDTKTDDGRRYAERVCRLLGRRIEGARLTRDVSELERALDEIRGRL